MFIKLQNVDHVALIDAQTHNTRSHAYSFVTSVVQSVCVCLLDFMATSKFALAITTGRPKGEDPNALKICNIIYQNLLYALLPPPPLRSRVIDA
jgi:hypothetical protein